MIKAGIDKIKQEGRGIKDEFRDKTLGYILAGFGLVAGLAWNEAIKSFIEYIFPVKANNIWAKFIYAIIITIVLVIISSYLSKILKGGKKNGNE